MAKYLEPIQSPANPKVRGWVKLHVGKRRRETGRFLIDGAYEIEQAVEGGVDFEEILISESLEDDTLAQWEKVSMESDIPLRLLSKTAFQKVSVREKPDGVIGVGICPNRNLALPETCTGPILVTNRLEKPGNLGALIRTAFAVGAEGIILCDPAVDFENPQVIRASRGLVFRLPGWTASPAEAMETFRQRNLTVIAADKGGEGNLWTSSWSNPPVIVLGEEHAGLPKEWDLPEVERVSIPMEEGIDSLNVSVSGALLLYEWRRRVGVET
ncbi:TrmH family RNA methyltransferase [Puniceicoccus vermicola]|nr:RNA methyltransferase [Puniceicoccus vermicola]